MKSLYRLRYFPPVQKIDTAIARARMRGAMWVSKTYSVSKPRFELHRLNRRSEKQLIGFGKKRSKLT